MTRADAGATGRTTGRRMARAAAGPVICAAAAIGLLAGWVGIGGAGTLGRVQLEVTFAAVPAVAAGHASTRHASTRQASTGLTSTGLTSTGTYLTIRNFSGRAYELTAASSPAARRASVLGHVVVPAHGSVTLSPFGNDVKLAGPRLPRPGQLVPLTLVFGQAGRVTIEATVTPPGTP